MNNLKDSSYVDHQQYLLQFVKISVHDTGCRPNVSCKTSGDLKWILVIFNRWGLDGEMLRIILATSSPLEKLAHSYALAQSVRLGGFELVVERSIADTRRVDPKKG